MLIQAAKSWLWGGNQAGLLLLAWFKSTVQHLWAAMVIENAYRQPSQTPIYSQFDHFKSDSCMMGLVILPVCNHRILKKKIEDLENSLQASQKDAEVQSSNVAFEQDFDELFIRHRDSYATWRQLCVWKLRRHSPRFRRLQGSDSIQHHTAYPPLLMDVINSIPFFLLPKASS